jgi:hypothetical protein
MISSTCPYLFVYVFTYLFILSMYLCTHLFIYLFIIYIFSYPIIVARGSVVVIEALCYKPEGRGFEPR